MKPAPDGSQAQRDPRSRVVVRVTGFLRGNPRAGRTSRAILRWKPVPVLALILALAALQPAGAARLPDWAKRIADTAPPVPEASPKDPARVLLSETTITVHPDGSYTTLQRTAAQACSAGARGVRFGFFPFDADSRITRSRAWHLPPDSRARKSQSGSWLDLTSSRDWLTDERTRVLSMDGVVKGSLVFFEFEAEETSPALAFTRYFSDLTPIDLATLKLELPEGWSAGYAWLHTEEAPPVTGDSTYTWSLSGIRPLPDDPLAGGVHDRAPALVVGIHPAPGAEVGPVVLDDWRSVAGWYENLARDQDAATESVSAFARAGAIDPSNGPLERIVATARLVRDRVRYLAVELGIGGYKPQSADRTASTLYGDCKAKTTLLTSLLGLSGIAVHPLLVNATIRDAVSPDVPSIDAFNHMIAAIALPDGVEPPVEMSSAILEEGDLGRFLVVDPTDEHAAIGHLPSALAGKRALLVAGDESRLVTLPPAKASDNLIAVSLDARLGEDGSLAVVSRATLTGQTASLNRAAYRRSAGEYWKEADRQIVRSWLDARIESREMEDEGTDGAAHESVSFTVPVLSDSGDGFLLPLFPGVDDALPRVSLSGREEAVTYDYPRTVRYVTRIEGLPERVSLPRASARSGDGWSSSTEVHREDGGVTARWELVITKTRFGPDEFKDLGALWSEIRSAGHHHISFVPASGDTPD